MEDIDYLQNNYFFHNIASFINSFGDFKKPEDNQLLARQLDALIDYMEQGNTYYPLVFMAYMYATRHLVDRRTGVVSDVKKWSENLKIICACASVLRSMKVITIEERRPLPIQSDAIESIAKAMVFINDQTLDGYHKLAFCPEMLKFVLNSIPQSLVNSDMTLRSSVQSINSALALSQHHALKIEPSDGETLDSGIKRKLDNDVVDGDDLIRISFILQDKALTYNNPNDPIKTMFDHDEIDFTYTMHYVVSTIVSLSKNMVKHHPKPTTSAKKSTPKKPSTRKSPKKASPRKSPKKASPRKSPKKASPRKSPKKTSTRKSPKKTSTRKSPKKTQTRRK